MGGKWALVVLLMLAGCTWGSNPKDSTPPDDTAAPCQPANVEIKCPETQPCPTALEILELKNQSLRALDDRERVIAGLRKEIESLNQDITRLKGEVDEWENRYYDQQRQQDSGSYGE